MKKRIFAVLLIAILILTFMPTSFAASMYKVNVKGTVHYDKAARTLELVNEVRAKAGQKPLVMSKNLQDAAIQRAAEISIYFSHTRPDSTECFTAVKWEAVVGENLAAYQTSPEQAVESWVNSPPHYANLVYDEFTSIGIGCFEGEDGKLYWTQFFDASDSKPVKVRKTATKIFSVKVSKAVVDEIQLDVTEEQAYKEVVFKDVAEGKWYTEYVRYAVENSLFNGTSEDQFSPNDKMNRAMFVTVLCRLSGATVSNSDKTDFSDVASGKWFTGAVKWAADNGIVTGVSETSFAPNNPVTREQMCTMLIRYANFAGIEIESVSEKESFSDDSKIANYAKEAVYICQMADIVNGVGDGKFAPKETATRGQVAKIFTVFHQMI